MLSSWQRKRWTCQLCQWNATSNIILRVQDPKMAISHIIIIWANLLWRKKIEAVPSILQTAVNGTVFMVSSAVKKYKTSHSLLNHNQVHCNWGEFQSASPPKLSFTSILQISQVRVLSALNLDCREHSVTKWKIRLTESLMYVLIWHSLMISAFWQFNKKVNLFEKNFLRLSRSVDDSILLFPCDLGETKFVWTSDIA